MRAVLEVFEEFERGQRDEPFPLVARLLLSVDRSGTAEAAHATVALAARLRAEAGAGRHVVGIDFSGNPTVSGFVHFADAFAAARAAGLRTVVHVAEVADDADTDAVLAFRPARLGHALHLSPAHVAALEAAPIPIELCPTSNLKTLRLQRLAQHPTLRRWLDGGYPVSQLGESAALPCLRMPPHQSTWCLPRSRPLLLIRERRFSRVGAPGGLRSSPQAAPKLRTSRMLSTRRSRSTLTTSASSAPPPRPSSPLWPRPLDCRRDASPAWPPPRWTTPSTPTRRLPPDFGPTWRPRSPSAPHVILKPSGFAG